MKILFTTVALLYSFILQMEIFSYRAECISMNEEGKILLQIWDQEKGKKYKIEQAEKDAVQYILYEGFHNNSCGYISPLLINKKAKLVFEDTHMYFFKGSGKYKKYVSSSKITEDKPSSVRDESWKVYEILVDKKSLDQHLVDTEIKEKLDNYTL